MNSTAVIGIAGILGTLMGVVIGAILTPYFESRAAKRARAEQLQLDTLIEIQDLRSAWVATVLRLRDLRITQIAAPPDCFVSGMAEAEDEFTGATHRMISLASRLSDKDLRNRILQCAIDASCIATVEDHDSIELLDLVAIEAEVCSPEYHSWINGTGTDLSLELGERIACLLGKDASEWWYFWNRDQGE